MIEEFTVENFLSFKEKVTLSFEANRREKHLSDELCKTIHAKSGNITLLKLGILYGANTSGKTNLIRALELIRNFFYDSRGDTDAGTVLDSAKDSFQFDSEYSSKVSSFSIVFYHELEKFQYSFSLDHKRVYKEELRCYRSQRPSLIFKRGYDSTRDIATLELGDSISIEKSDKDALERSILPNTSVPAASRSSNVYIESLKKIKDWFTSRWEYPPVLPSSKLHDFTLRQIVDGKISKKRLLEILQEADLGIEDIQIKEKKRHISDQEKKRILAWINVDDELTPLQRKEILQHVSGIPSERIIRTHLTHQIQQKDGRKEIVSLPLNMESLGTIRSLGLGGVMSRLEEKDLFLTVDELESSLHPDICEKFLENFLKHSHSESQFFFTTHNASLLQAKALFRKDTIWFIEKEKDGASRLYSLADFPSPEVSPEHSYYSLYREGRLGSVPNID